MGFTNVRVSKSVTFSNAEIDLYLLCVKMLQTHSQFTLGTSDASGFNLYGTLYHVNRDTFAKNAYLFGLSMDDDAYVIRSA